MAPLIDTSSHRHEMHYMDTSLSPPKNLSPTRRPRKNVKFSDYSEMYFVPSAAEMSDEELEATYMSDRDYRRIHREIDETMRLMKEGNYPWTSDKYFRGLEILLPHAKTQRKQRIAFMVTSVLQEQETKGQLHPEWVHNYLCALTIPFAHAAHVMGVYDSQSVFADIRQDMEQCLRKHEASSR